MDSSLAKELAAIKPHVVADIFREFNNLNLQLQDDEIYLIKSESSISAFIEKLLFYKRNIGYKEFTQVLCLKELNTCPSDDTLLIFIVHLKNVDDMTWQFRYLSAPEMPP